MLGSILFLSLHGAEQHSADREADTRIIKNIDEQYRKLETILTEELDGRAAIEALKQKCDDPKHKLSKKHKNILKRHKILIKKPCGGCLNIKKRYVVCYLVNHDLINRLLYNHSTQSAESDTQLTSEFRTMKDSSEKFRAGCLRYQSPVYKRSILAQTALALL